MSFTIADHPFVYLIWDRIRTSNVYIMGHLTLKFDFKVEHPFMYMISNKLYTLLCRTNSANSHIICTKHT